MKKVLFVGFFFLFLKTSHASTRPPASFDGFPTAKVITKGGKIIIGQLQYITDSTIQILPGTRKESRKGYYYKPVIVHYSEIISFRVRTDYWIGLLIGLIGAAGLVLIFTGTIPLFNNGLGEANIFIWLSPLLVGASISKMLQRKRFVINGSKTRFDQFKAWIEKKYTLL